MRVSGEKRAHAMPGQTFATVRANLGLIPPQLAAVLGVANPSVVVEWERGQRRVPDYIARHVLLLQRLREWEVLGYECKSYVATDERVRTRLLQLLRTSPLSVAKEGA